MPAVASDLNFGGAKAYVIASRARDCFSLALLQPVTLDVLNNLPDHHLHAEHLHQKALEHNTLLNYGFISGDMVPVPDPESRLSLTDPSGNIILTWESDTSQSQLKLTPKKKAKRPRPLDKDDRSGLFLCLLTCSTALTKHCISKAAKKRKPTKAHALPELSVSAPPEHIGTSWDPVDWSCAYDTVVVPLFHSIRARPLTFSSRTQSMSLYMSRLIQGFSLQSTEHRQTQLNVICNSLRDMLSAIDSLRFPRRGPHAISAFDILDAICGVASLEGVGNILCAHCAQSQLPSTLSSCCLGHYPHVSRLQILRTLYGSDVTAGAIVRSPIPFDDCLRAFCLNCMAHTDLSSLLPLCVQCSAPSPRFFKFCVMATPPLFFMDVSAWIFTTSPRLTLNFATVDGHEVHYHLCGAIYHAHNHWTSQWLSNEQVWDHDGQLHGGKLVFHIRIRDDAPTASNRHWVLQDKTLSILIYAIDC